MDKFCIEQFLQVPTDQTVTGNHNLPYLGIGLVILLAIVVYATMSASPPRSLYPSMADADKEQAQQLLTKNGVDVSLDPLTGALQVPASEFHQARIMLAAAGLPLYIHAPKVYADAYGVSLGALGAALGRSGRRRGFRAERERKFARSA